MVPRKLMSTRFQRDVKSAGLRGLEQEDQRLQRKVKSDSDPTEVYGL